LLPYWLLFLFFASAAMVGAGSAERPGEGRSAILLLAVLCVALMIGFRYEVGGDWRGYIRMHERAAYAPLSEVIWSGDPAYQLVDWLTCQLGAGIWLVNLICGLLFSWGLYRLVRIQPEPWLAMLVAVPYLIVVVAMGYSRQAVAIGILMAGMARIMRGSSPAAFFPYLIAAAFFHKTALIALPLCSAGYYKQRVSTILISLFSVYLIYSVSIQSSIDRMMHNYVAEKYSSQGAAIRVFMVAISAVVYFLFRKSMQFNEIEWKIWRNFSLASFLLVALLFLFPSSTVVDRFGLYLLPLQIATLPRIPIAVFKGMPARVAVIAFSFLVLAVWLNYGANARFWLPYRLYPLI
jgi:hypothetical protein